MTGATVGIASQYFGDPIRLLYSKNENNNIYLTLSTVVSLMVSTMTWPRTTAGFMVRITLINMTE